MSLSLPRKAHQDADIEWIHRVGRGLLANEPGTGKSRSAIEAFDGGNNLVIAPNLVIEGGTWRDEIEKWSNHPEKWQIVPYSMLNARQWSGALKPGWPTIGPAEVPNFSGTTPVQSLRPELGGEYDAVVVDEAHYTKGRKTSWTWAAQQIAKRSSSLLEMTGTPMPNWSHELFTLLQAIYPEEAARTKRFGAYWRWVEEWFMVTPSKHNAQAKVIGDLLACRAACYQRPAWDPCEHYTEFAVANLGERYRRVLRDDCLDLPPLTEQNVDTPMDAVQRRLYRELRDDFITTYRGEEVVAWSQGAKNVLLDRVTTSPWCVDPQGPAKGGKFEALRFDLEGRSRPTLVLAHYRTSVEGCADVARQVGASAGYIHGGVSDRDSGRLVRQFQSGQLDVLVGSLETLAEGLTLTRADMAIFVESSYKPSRNTQAKYRIHRLGQEHPCLIRHYRTPGTVDARKHELLAIKNDRQMRTLTAAQFAAML